MKYFKFFWTAVFCIAFLLTSVASAAQKSDSKAVKALRDSMYATLNENQKIFHEFLLFMVPGFQSELTFNGKIIGDKVDIAGDFGLWMNDNSGKSIPVEVPFYIKHDKDLLDVYYKSDNNQWKKYEMPTVAASLADTFVTPNKEEIEKEIARVKSVSILRETDSRRTLLVTLDGKKLADELKLQVEKNPADKGTAAEAEMQADLFDYIDKALRKSDIWYVWTIDKKTNQTKHLNIDLSNVVRETANAALNDPTKNYPDVINEILETLAFYSECKLYTTVLDDSAQSSLEIPQEVINNAVEVKDVVPESAQEKITASK